MATTYLVGNDGDAVLPSSHLLNVKVWAANVAYVSSDLTGFTNTGKVRRLGIADITGSLNGTAIQGTGTPWGTLASTSLPSQPGGTLVLSVDGTTSGTSSGAYLSFGAVFNSYAFSVDKNGEQSLSVNFEMNDGDGATVVWATT